MFDIIRKTAASLAERNSELIREAKKPISQRLGEFVDPDKAKRRTKILVFISFILAVIATYLYKAEVNRKEKHIKAVASIRQFAVDYDPSLEGKTDLEILAAVHLLTLELFNWTLKIEELEAELKILTKMLPEWQSFERNLYYFSSVKKSWSDARKDCQQRHAADLVTCRFGEEQEKGSCTAYCENIGRGKGGREGGRKGGRKEKGRKEKEGREEKERAMDKKGEEGRKGGRRKKKREKGEERKKEEREGGREEEGMMAQYWNGTTCHS
ncbi:putative antigen B [Crotalus adamanteus]|uniref:Antigen B n=1 Tax=Crotalus adamanteus TaxID=8729 RepID=A0AAW1B9W7_CROAD